MMRVLIVTVTAGHGHNATAVAMEERLRADGAQAQVLDLYKYISKLLYTVVDKGYLFSVKHFPGQFGRAYSNLERYETLRKVVGIVNDNRFIAKRLAGFLQEHAPDLILTSHVFAAQVLDVLKRQDLLDLPIMGINTDYCIHPFWEDVPTVDYIVTASDLLRYTAELRGIHGGRLLPLGIPTGERFRQRTDKKEARRQLDLDENKTTILLMGGSMGFGNMLRNVAKIDAMGRDYQLVCICGNNERLYRQIGLLKTKTPIHLIGFTKQVDLYMDAADCIVTKPGGLTVSEALAKGLPMILTNPIPGQEDRNANFLLNVGAAVMVSKYFSIAEAVYYVLESQGRLELMHQSVALIARPDAAEQISKFVLQLGEKK